MVHRAVCPGSFDPITMGHVDIFRRAARQFDEMVVLVTGNPNKPSGLFSISERVELAEKAVADLERARAIRYLPLSRAQVAAIVDHTLLKPEATRADAEATIAETMLPNAEVFSVKPLAGHCQGAAGAVELAASLLGYERGEIPASPRVAEAIIPQLLDGRTDLVSGLTLKTSLGMGGHNAAVVLAPNA